MKKDVRREESFIFTIYNKRNKVNEIAVLIPFILALAFSLLGAPVIIVKYNVPPLLIPLPVIGPILCVLIFYLIRKKIIINRFIKIRDVGGRVELTDVQSDDFEAAADGNVFMFGYSEYMVTVLYNWLHSLNVTGPGKLKMYKVFYDYAAPVYLAVCEKDLCIPEEVRKNYEKETAVCLHLSDMVHGKAVNMKIMERIRN